MEINHNAVADKLESILFREPAYPLHMQYNSLIKKLVVELRRGSPKLADVTLGEDLAVERIFREDLRVGSTEYSVHGWMQVCFPKEYHWLKEIVADHQRGKKAYWKSAALTPWE